MARYFNQEQISLLKIKYINVETLGKPEQINPVSARCLEKKAQRRGTSRFEKKK